MVVAGGVASVADGPRRRLTGERWAGVLRLGRGSSSPVSETPTRDFFPGRSCDRVASPRMLVPCDAVERPVAEEIQVPRHELAGLLDEDAVVALRKHHDRRVACASIAEGLAA